MKLYDLMTQIIKPKLAHEKQSVWKTDSTYIDLKNLSIDTRGQVGEELLARSLQSRGYNVEWDNKTDADSKHWDIRVSSQYTFEVKTATLGRTGKTFQHENIVRVTTYDALVFLDIAPDDIYLTIAKKSDLPFITANDLFTKTVRKMHRRKDGTIYKFDLSINDVANRKIKTVKDVARQFYPIIGDP